MKRRNVDCSKLRRPLKRSRIAEGIHGRYAGGGAPQPGHLSSPRRGSPQEPLLFHTAA